MGEMKRSTFDQRKGRRTFVPGYIARLKDAFASEATEYVIAAPRF